MIATFGELKKLAKLIKLTLEKKEIQKNCQFFGHKKQQTFSGKKKKKLCLVQNHVESIIYIILDLIPGLISGLVLQKNYKTLIPVLGFCSKNQT